MKNEGIGSSVSSESSLPSLQMAAFSLNPHMVEGYSSNTSSSSYKSTRPIGLGSHS